jgi:hypothetical protein
MHGIEWGRMKPIPVVLLLMLYLTACVQPGLQRNNTIDCRNKQTPQDTLKTPSDFAQAIKTLETGASGKGADAAQASLDLSVLYSHHDNPAPDYAKALSSLERYIQLSGNKTQPANIQNRLDLLRKLNGLLADGEKDSKSIELMRQDNRTLMLEIQKLKNEIDTLQNENLAMKQTMERLNQLEMQHEQKRKQLQ